MLLSVLFQFPSPGLSWLSCAKLWQNFPTLSECIYQVTSRNIKFIASDICKTSEEKWLKKCKYLWIECICFNLFWEEWLWDCASRFAYNEPYELNKMCDYFFMDFSFFAHRLFYENLWFFFTNASCLGGMWNYVQGPERRTLIFGSYMASIAEC